MDISEFYDTFFEEAEELLEDMEAHLLDLDLENPDIEQLNAIFRAAHSIKGGAGTFGFTALQRTTHLLENLLDQARRGEMTLRRDIVDTFLEAKDMLHDQLDAYRQGGEPDPQALERICTVLQRLAIEEMGEQAAAEAGLTLPAASAPEPSAPAPSTPAPAAPPPVSAGGPAHYRVALIGVDDKDRQLLIDELGHLGDIEQQSGDGQRYEVVLASSASAADIEAVMCFVAEPEQLDIEPLDGAPSSGQPRNEQEATSPGGKPVAAPAAPASAELAGPPKPADSAPQAPPASSRAPRKAAPRSESSSIRVPVSKVDQIINLVGELIITQSMLNQVAGELSDTGDGNLVSGLNLLQRNARDLQEAVMSVRMVPMDYVFSRFPRLVRDVAGKFGKEVELVTEGRSTELDKSLTERIIDPLTHLVRNSLDHGLEMPEVREAAGKPRTGRLRLSAQHQGGNILIEVSDDGAGLNREKILAKARERGLNVSDSMSDEEVWPLIFAPGFSTATEISDVSGRGVGMDVVKRNIQTMGGHVEILSRPGQGTTTRIILPLTLAILDGMSIRVGREMFILPVSAVIESLQPRADDLYTMAGGEQLLKVREDYLPVVAVYQAMQVSGACEEATRAIAVIVQGEGRRYALLVDELVGQQQVVVKNLETNYRKVPGVSAATILGDGSVALILDVADLSRLGHDKKKGATVAAPTLSTTHEEVELS